jgi:pyruvate,water dikinase
MSTFLLPFSTPDATLDRVGGKGANLAELARAGFAVPPGFLITTEAYHTFVALNQLGRPIVELARQVAADDPVALEQVGAEIRALFMQGRVPDEVASAIVAAYDCLGPAEQQPQAVAVRSSATAEDLPGLSFAGQQDTYLNIVGQEALLDAVKRCWASLWTARAIGYRARNQIAPDDVALAVVVQQLVPSEVSGVLFTANPLTGRRDEIVIDASFGLGEAIVSGQVEPDHYVVDPQTWRVTSRKLGAKAMAIVPEAGGGTSQVARSDDHQALPDAQIIELARVAQRVAGHFGSPQDIEWAWAEQRLYLLQSRPITSLYPLPDLPTKPGETRVYFSFNSVQGVIDPFTALGRDLLQVTAGGALELLGVEQPACELIPAAGDRLFIDLTESTQIGLAALKRIDPGARETLARLIDEGRVAAKSPFSPASIWKLLPVLLPILGRVLATLQAPTYARARARWRRAVPGPGTPALRQCANAGRAAGGRPDRSRAWAPNPVSDHGVSGRPSAGRHGIDRPLAGGLAGAEPRLGVSAAARAAGQCHHRDGPSAMGAGAADPRRYRRAGRAASAAG